MYAAISSGHFWTISNGARATANASGSSTWTILPSAGCRRNRSAGSRTRSRRIRLRRFRVLDLIEREQQHANAAGGGAPVRQALIVVDQPVERHLNRDEGG